jgi:Sec-independent protein translocase protein TatA
LFGNRLPKLMRDLGRGLTEFKRGLHEESGE